MNNARPPESSPQEREAALFEMALEKTGAERAAFLDSVCSEDSALHARVKALLAVAEPDDDLFISLSTARRSSRAQLPVVSPDEAVGQTIGRYKLLENLGEGGCGAVYVAEQTEPVRRRVALKVIKLGMDTKAVVARFEAERQALALMDHPIIAKVFDAGSTETGRPYFVMELVRGIKITEYCDQNKLPTNERLKLFIQVCNAIQHAHQKGIIHRDIKPSNILVTLQDGVPVPKVIDFGIAKATDGRLTDATVYTQLHQLIGTPAYMSPEQAEMTSVDVDTRSDIYSLGVLLYELLTGQTPFDAKELLSAGLDAMRRTIRETEPLRPSTRLTTLKAEELTTTAKRRATEVPKLISLLKGDLDWVVMKCLEKDRTRRYATANGLASDLQRHLNEEPVIARPASSMYRLRKWVRRNKLIFAAGSAVILALVLGLSAATAMFLRERTLRQLLMASEREQALERAEAAAMNGDPDAMQRVLDDAERRGVSDAHLQMLQGLNHVLKGHSPEAVKPLEQAVKRMPQSVAARALLACSFAGRDWQRNEEELGHLLPLQPTTWEDYLFKGLAMSWADPARGLALMDRAVELKRNSPFARLLRADARTQQAMSTGDLTMMQSAFVDLEAAGSFLPPGSGWLMSSFTWTHVQAARLCGQAGRGYEQQQYLQAAEKWGQRLEQLPEGVWMRIAQLELCGRETQAFELMQKTATQHPHWELPLCPYGDALYRQGQVQQAYDFYAGMAEARKASEYTEYMRLIIRIELSGGGERVRADVDQFYMKYSGGMVELGAPDTYRFAGLMDEAKRRGMANYERLPPRLSFFGAHYRRWAQFLAGVLDEADLLEASRGSGKELVEVYTSIGILHLAQGDRTGAKQCFQKSVQTGFYGNPYYQFARNLLARLEKDPNWPPWIPLRPPAADVNQGKTYK